MAKAGNKIERSLYYYDLELYEFEDGKKTHKQIDDFKEAIIDIFDEIKNKETPEEMKIKLDTGNQLFFLVDSIDDKKIEYRMVLVRVDALPYIEKEGALESLEEILEEDQNIAEITHCVLFPEDKVVGVEFNFTGARASALSEYIKCMREEIAILTCRPKVNTEVFKKLDIKEGFTLFDFAIKTDSKAFVNILANKSIFRALHEDARDADVVEVILKKKKSKSNTNKFMPILSIEEMEQLTIEYKDDIKRFGVSQGTITSDKVDLLSDKYVKKATFRQKNGRVVDSTSVYNEISRFYNRRIKEE